MLNSSAKVILATIAAKGRVLNFSMAAFLELELSLALFEKARENPVINHALVRWSVVLVSALDNLYNPNTAFSEEVAGPRTRYFIW